jgi:hypothetical protein
MSEESQLILAGIIIQFILWVSLLFEIGGLYKRLEELEK